MTPTAELRTEIAGYYRFEVGVPGEPPRLVTDWIPNLITNGGLDRLGTGSFADYCSVGSGGAAPAVTDSALAAHVAVTSAAPSLSQGAAAAPPYYGYARFTFVFAQGAAAGNLSEVGVGWGNTGANLFSRALITPSITVFPIEVLTVVYEVRKYAPTADVTGSVTIAGTARAFVVRPANVTGAASQEGWGGLAAGAGVALGTAFNGGSNYGRAYSAAAVLGANTGVPIGGTQELSFSVGNATNAAYVGGSFSRDATIAATIAQANLSGGVACVTIQHSLGYYQCSLTPALEKDGTKTMSLTFRFSWARRP